MNASKQSIAAKKAWITIRAKYSKEEISSWRSKKHKTTKPKPTKPESIQLITITFPVVRGGTYTVNGRKFKA